MSMRARRVRGESLLQAVRSGMYSCGDSRQETGASNTFYSVANDPGYLYVYEDVPREAIIVLGSEHSQGMATARASSESYGRSAYQSSHQRRSL